MPFSRPTSAPRWHHRTAPELRPSERTIQAGTAVADTKESGIVLCNSAMPQCGRPNCWLPRPSASPSGRVLQPLRPRSFRSSERTAAPEVLPVERADIQLRVTNDNWADAKIYVVAGGSLQRVGTVISMRRDAPVRLPQGLVSATRDCILVVELIGSRARYVSPRLVLTPGETIDLRISNSLQLSHVSIW
jgi:hypothetical protein